MSFRGIARFEPGNGASTNDNRVNVKLLRQLTLPLVAKMRRAQNADAASVAPLQKFAIRAPSMVSRDPRRLQSACGRHQVRGTITSGMN
jgi:hypothetical protein